MNRLILNNFKEYGAENAPSIAELRTKESYTGKEKIVQFLKEKGEIGLTTAKLPADRLTGERIAGELVTRETDKFIWWSDLAYHVDKYNLHLPKEFEDYVLDHS